MKEMELKIKSDQAMQEIAKFHFILSEGRKGHHLLFTHDMIRHAFAKDQNVLFEVFHERITEINHVLNHTFSLSTFEEKCAYIKTLSEDIQDALVYGYFQLLEDSENQPKKRWLH